MNEKQKLEMIAMCAQALADGKKLQYRVDAGSWKNDNNSHMVNVSSEILNEGFEYRIKPEPKTMRYRNWLASYRDGFYVICCATNDGIDAAQNDQWFVKWLTDEITVELPE